MHRVSLRRVFICVFHATCLSYRFETRCIASLLRRVPPQNYSFASDVPRGTLNNDKRATIDQTPSNATNG
jgi:hypothetical protein